jgi:hypothetical protein
LQNNRSERARRKAATPFIVYVFNAREAVPYMEFLPQTRRLDALKRAMEIMRLQACAERAELWCDDTLVGYVRDVRH